MAGHNFEFFRLFAEDFSETQGYIPMAGAVIAITAHSMSQSNEITDEVLAGIEGTSSMFPLHIPAMVTGIKSFMVCKLLIENLLFTIPFVGEDTSFDSDSLTVA